MPCLTIVQHPYKINWEPLGRSLAPATALAAAGAPTVQGMRGCKIEVPTQVLPQANRATILSRLRKWCAWTAIGIGQMWKQVAETPFGLGAGREQEFDYDRLKYKVTLMS